MKKTTINIVIFTLLGLTASVLLYSCEAEREYTVSVTVLVDQTEPGFLSQPEAGAIKTMFRSNDSLWQGFHLRLLALSDVDLNPAVQADLPPECQFLSNNYSRKDRVKKFSTDIDSSFEKILSAKPGKINSSIYSPLADELKRLSETKAKQRVLVIYSDLMEHSALADFYQKKQLQHLKTAPDSVRQELEKRTPLPVLTGITVHIIYQPRSAAENEQFHIVSEFYKGILEQKGAQVSIGANLVL